MASSTLVPNLCLATVFRLILSLTRFPSGSFDSSRNFDCLSLGIALGYLFVGTQSIDH
jgi:hypothetical protein